MRDDHDEQSKPSHNRSTRQPRTSDQNDSEQDQGGGSESRGAAGRMKAARDGASSAAGAAAGGSSGSSSASAAKSGGSGDAASDHSGGAGHSKQHGGSDRNSQSNRNGGRHQSSQSGSENGHNGSAGADSRQDYNGQDNSSASDDDHNSGSSGGDSNSHNSDDSDRGNGDDNNNDSNDNNDDGDDHNSDDDSDSGSGGDGNSLAGKAKDMSSNATGVDYSDKGLKDQLEHQAADTAMDATPGLQAANSARKALKNFNKQKANAGMGNNGLSDKVEDVADKGVDAGIKGAKYGAAGGAAASGMSSAAMAAGTAKLIGAVKSVVTAAVSKVAGLVSSAFSAVSSAVSAVAGVGSAVANAITSVAAAGSILITSVAGVVVLDDNKDPGGVQCVPEYASVASELEDMKQDSGKADTEARAIREEYAKRLWSVFSEVGASPEKTAAVMGNFYGESSVDPTTVETVHESEAFAYDKHTKDAEEHHFAVQYLAPDYADRFPNISKVGIGLGQWTNGRNQMLIDYAKENNANWYDFDTQITFMLDEENGDAPSRVRKLKDFLKGDGGNVDEEVMKFMKNWEGLSPDGSETKRQKKAHDFLFVIKDAKADKDYADSILNQTNVAKSEANHQTGQANQDDGCGNPVKSHYAGDVEADGTGTVPDDLDLVPWTRETLPESLEKYAQDPADAGLAWHGSEGWANDILPGQCVALASSYFMQLYPGWNDDGRPDTRPTGDGRVTAPGWADHYGQETVDTPKSGAVFTDKTTSDAGHTGIVQHVFKDESILIAEQNIGGASGANNGEEYSWSWRVLEKERWHDGKHMEFFKPGAKPQWKSENTM